MDSKIGIRRDSKKTLLTKICNGQNVVENNDRPRPDGTGHIEVIKQKHSFTTEIYII